MARELQRHTLVQKLWLLWGKFTVCVERTTKAASAVGVNNAEAFARPVAQEWFPRPPAPQSESVLKSLCSTTAAKQEKWCKVEKTFSQMLFLWLVIWLLHAWNCALFEQLLELTCSTYLWVPWAATSFPQPQHLHWLQQDPARLCCACQSSLLPIHRPGVGTKLSLASHWTCCAFQRVLTQFASLCRTGLNTLLCQTLN